MVIIMANLQSQFIKFHNNIKLEDENETLREKREKILKRIKEKISDDAPSYVHFNQGSYAMHTGIVPLDNGEYDIDLGLKFDMSTEDADPVKAKQWVYDAVVGHTDDVVFKNPCITVSYKENGEPSYHVDITVYSVENEDGKNYLARGKQYSTKENQKWEPADSQGLIDLIRDYSQDEKDREQFRRCIRYLKRWKDIHFKNKGNGKPTGIALTVAAYNYFTPGKEYDFVEQKYKYNDLNALINFINSLKSTAFGQLTEYDETDNQYKTYKTISLKLPVEPYCDLFDKMSNKQMTNFYNKLGELLEKLNEAMDEVDPVDAAEILQNVFGQDFPVPSTSETGKTQHRVISTHTDSA